MSWQILIWFSMFYCVYLWQYGMKFFSVFIFIDVTVFFFNTGIFKIPRQFKKTRRIRSFLNFLLAFFKIPAGKTKNCVFPSLLIIAWILILAKSIYRNTPIWKVRKTFLSKNAPGCVFYENPDRVLFNIIKNINFHRVMKCRN